MNILFQLLQVTLKARLYGAATRSSIKKWFDALSDHTASIEPPAPAWLAAKLAHAESAIGPI